MLKADAKAQVSYDYDSGKITTFLCSVQHVPNVKVDDFRSIIENLMVRTATAYGLNTDFVKLVNPTGRFVLGSSFADCGVTGRKLACDTYGGIGHIGGGAMSGKDPSKVDRSGACQADQIHHADIQAVQNLYHMAQNTATSIDHFIRRIHALQETEVTAVHGTKLVSVTLKRIRCAWSV